MDHAHPEAAGQETPVVTDFVIVIATVAALASPGGTASVPLNAPTVGFRTYPDVAACERAVGSLVAPAGARLVCLPIEPLLGEMATAY